MVGQGVAGWKIIKAVSANNYHHARLCYMKYLILIIYALENANYVVQINCYSLHD